MKANLLYILFLFHLFIFSVSHSQEIDKRSKKLELTKNTDSITKNKIRIQQDSIYKDSIIKSKEILSHIVTHNAKDYVIQDVRAKTVTLYNKAELNYNDINIKAGEIKIDYENSLIYAKGIYEVPKEKNKKDKGGDNDDKNSKEIDSIKKIPVYGQHPVFKQGDQESKQDSVVFNFKSKKALVYGVKTKEGEMLVFGEKVKRVNDSTVYIRNIKFTTSNKKNPDYYIQTRKAKLVPGKKIIVGASNMVVADVPTPIFLPFAYFPLEKKRTSGFLIPSYGDNRQQGFFLQNGGYYFVVSDYLDLQLTGDIYSNGSWAVNTSSNYVVKYKYSGEFSFRYLNMLNSIRGFDDYSKNTNYKIAWRHSQDRKSSPNSSFRANVDLGSSKFYRESFNEIDRDNELTNTMRSSINYSNSLVGTPFNMSITLSHGQNTNTEFISMTLPSINVNMNRLYPFQGKGGAKKNVLQNIGIGYNMNSDYKIKTNDDDFMTAKMWKQAQSGVKHNVSTGTKIKLLKYLTLSPNANYSDVWFFKTIEQRFDPFKKENGKLGSIIKDTISGFRRFNTFSTSASLSTTRYGMFNLNMGRLKVIRHVLKPSVSWKYTPNIGKRYKKTVQSSNEYPYRFREYTIFNNGVYSPPSTSESNNVTFRLSNNFEAKVSPKKTSEDDDSEKKDKKIVLLNNLDFNSSYDVLKDSLNWADCRFNASTIIFNKRLNLNLIGNLDPYQVTDKGIRINKFNPAIFRLEQIELTSRFSLSNKDFEKKKDKKGKNQENENQDPNNTVDMYRIQSGGATNSFASELNSKNRNKNKTASLYRAKMPWNITFEHQVKYQNNGFRTSEIYVNSLAINGSIEFSPKWKVTGRTGYDFKGKGPINTHLGFSRDLDSFRFNFTWVPFGASSSYNFFIGIKSSLLSDLKWDKKNPPDRTLY